MSDFAKTIPAKPTPPAAGQFGLRPPSEIYPLKAYRPIGCPSLDQFEARLMFTCAPVRSSEAV